MISNKNLEKIIEESSYCQRNWDLSKQIKQEDIETMKVAVSRCPSKQNRIFYKVLYTQNRSIIEKIHEQTDGFTIDFEDKSTTTNPQVLANILFIFVRDKENKEGVRTIEEWNDGNVVGQGRTYQDEDRSIGVASGYLAMTANILGYKTGYCQCFNDNKIKELLQIDNEILLLIGVGYEDTTKSRLEHHKDPNLEFWSFSKNIEVKEIL
jgi:nitroreductase